MDAGRAPQAASHLILASQSRGTAWRWRRATGLTVALAAATIVVLGTVSLLLDSRLATRALTLTDDNVRWGTFISALGSSWWMFAAALLGTGLLWGMQKGTQDGHRRRALQHAKERAGFLLATLCAEVVAVQTVKHLVGRARPHDFENFGPYHFDVLSLTDDLASFPSGHSCTAFAMATSVALLFPRYRVAAFTMASAVALSRVVVQAHYVSDIVAGSALGCVTALLMGRAFARQNIAFTRTAQESIVPKRLEPLVAATAGPAGPP